MADDFSIKLIKIYATAAPVEAVQRLRWLDVSGFR